MPEECNSMQSVFLPEKISAHGANYVTHQNQHTQPTELTYILTDMQISYTQFAPWAKISFTVQRRPNLFFRRAFDNAVKKAEIEDFHMHDLRHTSASYLLMAGVDLRTLADILGHSSMQMVQRYTHLLDDHKLKAIDQIEGLGDWTEEAPHFTASASFLPPLNLTTFLAGTCIVSPVWGLRHLRAPVR